MELKETYEVVYNMLCHAQHELYDANLDNSLIYRILGSCIDFLSDLL